MRTVDRHGNVGVEWRRVVCVFDTVSFAAWNTSFVRIFSCFFEQFVTPFETM